MGLSPSPALYPNHSLGTGLSLCNWMHPELQLPGNTAGPSLHVGSQQTGSAGLPNTTFKKLFNTLTYFSLKMGLILG